MEPGNLATSARKLEEWKYGTLKLANMEPETLVLCDTITVGGKTKKHTENISNTNKKLSFEGCTLLCQPTLYNCLYWNAVNLFSCFFLM